MSFGERLLEVRKKREFSQAELADLLNTKAPVIGRYEREEATPSVEVALKLAKILGVSLDYLTGNTNLEFDQKTLKRIEDISKMNDQDRSFVLRAVDVIDRDLKRKRLMRVKSSTSF
jgi:transcriptional regulator with XRE-family HTH domain